MDPHFVSLCLGRLLLAALLGAAFGIERDLNARPAGLRTSIMIAMSACLFTLVSMQGFADMNGVDPTRIAAQIVTGVGFLGAGVLLKGDRSITGLTTASSIWLVAAVGMTVAVGWYILAVSVTAIALILLVLLQPLSHTLDTIGAKRVKKKGGIVLSDE